MAGACFLTMLLTGGATLWAKGPVDGGGQEPSDEAGNNLSFPVIWGEGVPKVLPGTAGMEPQLVGEWWYQWGTNGVDPEVTPASCPPDPDETNPDLNPEALPLCDDGIEGVVDMDMQAGLPPADNPLPLVKAYLQKDQNNIWQALSGTPTEYSVAEPDGQLYVDWIDWGDNLESVDWYTRSQVRTEVVLFKDNPDVVTSPWLEYGMRHTDGWGINEVHGLAASIENGEPEVLAGDQATVYSHCARFTIQKLLVERDDPRLSSLIWIPGEGWTEPQDYPDDLINPPIFNGSVYEGGDGPGYYSAEINVKGRIIYGYTWNVRKLNDMAGETAAGDYRLTFSFDEICGDVSLNTFFIEGRTQILVPIEEEEVLTNDTRLHDDGQLFFGPSPVTSLVAKVVEEEPGGGGEAKIDFDKNLTYMDIRIHERSGGAGGKDREK